MKKFLLLLCILSITLSAKAQLFGKDWVAGSYTDSSGKAFSGLIYYSVSDPYSLKIKGDQILFKTDKDAEKQKIPAGQIRGFIIGSDNFAVSRFKPLKNYPFLQIIIDHQTKLYYSAVNPALMPTVGAALVGGAIGAAAFNSKGSAYYYGPDPDHITLIKGKNFMEIMSMLMADKPEVVAKIKDKTFKLGSINDLLSYYNTGVLPKMSLDDVY